jgi:hypothetical protein
MHHGRANLLHCYSSVLYVCKYKDTRYVYIHTYVHWAIFQNITLKIRNNHFTSKQYHFQYYNTISSLLFGRDKFQVQLAIRDTMVITESATKKEICRQQNKDGGFSQWVLVMVIMCIFTSGRSKLLLHFLQT